MADLPETPGWEATIKQLEEDDMAEGGRHGIANLQATQLANRTQFLKIGLESIPDFREYTFYITNSDPDGTIAGLASTPEGKPFRVGLGPGKGFVIYMNDGGVAKEIARTSGADEVDTLNSLISRGMGEKVFYSFEDDDGFSVADILIDEKSDLPAIRVGGFSISNDNDTTLSFQNEDGFTISLDDLLNRLRKLETSDDVVVAKGDDIVSGLQSVSNAYSLAMSERVVPPIATLRKGVNIYIAYGQSLSIGAEAFSVVTRTPSKLGNKMLGKAVRGQYYYRTQDPQFGPIGGSNIYYDLEEKRQDGANIITDPSVSTSLGETVMSGFLETLKTLHNRSKGVANDDEVILAGSVTGAVGTTLATLLKGAGTSYYERLYTCIQGHIEAAASAGYEDVQVAGVLFLQGENDYASNTTRDSYLTMLKKLFADIDADVKLLTGQSNDVGFFTYQTGGHYITTALGNTLPVAMAQIDVTDLPGTFMAAPMFPYPQAIAARTHKAANSYRWWGCAAAHTVWKVMNEDNHAPFKMIKAVYDGEAIYVAFRTPCPPLTTQPFYRAATPVLHSDMGFSVIDHDGTLSGTSLSVSFVAPCVVKIVASRALGATIRINLGDAAHTGGHNIADSSPQLSIFKWQYYGDDNQSTLENIEGLNNKLLPLYNYAVIQTIDVKEV